MAKALKIVGTIAVVAGLAVVTGGAALGLGLSLGTTFLGVSAGVLLVAGGVLTAAGGLLDKPPIPQSQIDRLNASVDPRTPRKTALGSTALATDIRYQEWSGGDQEYCDWIVCVASHAIDGLGEIWLNDEQAWTAAGGVAFKYAGYFFVPNVILEGSAANAFTFASSKWNASHRLTGCAYVRLTFKVTGNSSKAESPFSSGVPTRITIIGRGARLYDPRRDSTVPSGAGAMRATDQATWRFTADDGAVIGENVALLILRVLLGWKIGGKQATGSGIPPARIDMQSFIVAANQCDELVTKAAGGTEPRYRAAGVLSESDDAKTQLDMLCAACSGRFRDTGGKLALVIMHNDLAEMATDEGLLDDDVVGPFTWNPDPALDQTPTVARGRYTDPSPASLYQLIPYPDVAIASTDGIERPLPLDLAAVESPSQAQRIAKQALQRRQYARTFTAPFDIRAWKYPVGKVLPFTFAPLGFVRAPFRVAEQEIGQGGTCVMTLSAESPAMYAWDAEEAPAVVAAAPIIYDPTKAPLVQAINGTASGAALEAATVTIAAQGAALADATTQIATLQTRLDNANIP